MASTLSALREERDAKAKSLHDVFEQAGDEMDMSKVTLLDGDSATKAAEIKRRNDELTDLGKQVDAAAELVNIKDGLTEARKSAGKVVGLDMADMGEARPAPFGIKAALDASEGLKAIQSGVKKTGLLFEIPDPEQTDAFLSGVKTTLLLTDIAPLADRQPQLVPSAQNRIMVSDLMAAGSTNSNSITYYEETTFTNAAVEVAENTAKPEAALDFTERTDTVRKIATWIPISDEALSDNAQLRSYVEGRLIYMVRQREEAQLLVGNGTPPNIQGILNRSGIQTQAKGGDPTPDAFFKAMTKVRVTGDADPSAHVIHPNDWQDIRLLRTIDGVYIWGSPQDAGPERLWGLPVRVTTGITEGTGLTGAFDVFSQIFRREGLRVEASTEHASYFIENKVALLAETRLALAVYRPAAFASVTGI